ncbi:MAG: S9 family peptidase [Ardenticatenales bacterium]|nr:S9 family peptidase [Ardenticatenales bacterium]
MIKRLFEVPMMVGTSGHPARSDFLYFSNETGIPLLYHWDPARQETRLLTPGTEPIMSKTCLHPTEPRAIFLKDSGGNMDFALYQVDFEGNQERLMPGTLGFVLHLYWATDGDWLLGGHDHGQAYLRRLSPDGTLRDLFTSEKQIMTSAYDPQRELLVASVGRGAGTRLVLVDAREGWVREWVSESDSSEDILPALQVDKGYLAYVTDAPGTHQELVVRATEGLAELLRVPVPGELDWMVGELLWVDEVTLFAVMAKAGQLSAHFLDIRTGRWSEPVTEGSVFNPAITRDGLVWVNTGFAQVPRIQSYRDGKVVELFAVSSVLPIELSVESHWYPSFDGRMVQGWLIRSQNPHAPLVVYGHGGPTVMTGNWWDPMMLAPVLAGYHLFAPNFRGSTSFGAEFRDLNIGDLGGGDLQDVLYGARSVSALLGLESKPAILGASYGGYLTLQALTTQPDAWAGGVAIVAPVDWAQDYELSGAHYRSWLLHFFGGTPEEKPELYRERSPRTYVEQLAAPVLILHGENDAICPIEPVKEFAAEAARLGLPARLLITEDEGHGALQNANAIRECVQMLEHLRTLFD